MNFIFPSVRPTRRTKTATISTFRSLAILVMVQSIIVGLLSLVLFERKDSSISFLPQVGVLYCNAAAQQQQEDEHTNNCVKEFETCTTTRDCCQTTTTTTQLQCVAGDWSVTTDSTCLSSKSQQINNQNYSFEQRVELVRRYYAKINNNNNKNSITDIERIVTKYGKSKFPQLVSRLETKYNNVEFKFDLNNNDDDNQQQREL